MLDSNRGEVNATPEEPGSVEEYREPGAAWVVRTHEANIPPEFRSTVKRVGIIYDARQGASVSEATEEAPFILDTFEGPSDFHEGLFAALGERPPLIAKATLDEATPPQRFLGYYERYANTRGTAEGRLIYLDDVSEEAREQITTALAGYLKTVSTQVALTVITEGEHLEQKDIVLPGETKLSD